MQRWFETENDLIIDLGMNNGDDAEYYLKKNFRVVAVEANPALCDLAAKRLAEAVTNGRLMILALLNFEWVMRHEG
jgi:predicted RNA methylase